MCSIRFAIVLPWARIVSSLPGLIFAMMVNPWQAGVRGYTGPYLPFFRLRYPSFGIAIAAGFVQSRAFSLGVEGVSIAVVAILFSLCLMRGFLFLVARPL